MSSMELLYMYTGFIENGILKLTPFLGTKVNYVPLFLTFLFLNFLIGNQLGLYINLRKMSMSISHF